MALQMFVESLKIYPNSDIAWLDRYIVKVIILAYAFNI